MTKKPIVSVICLCHNQGKYVKEAIYSILKQSYTNIDLIVVDDGSSDNSKQIIDEVTGKENLQFISIDKPIGNCKAFNRGFQLSMGDYIIDLAADDLLLPRRVEEGVETFSKKNISIEFCNVMNVDANGNFLSIHFEENTKVPEGDIYLEMIKKYLISPPGMMIRREVLKCLGGYDESLSYEDFDFWIRSSRKYRYGYTPQTLVKKRNTERSLSKAQFRFRSKHQKSTLSVCEKIKSLNKTIEEQSALKARCYYEIKQCLRYGNLELIPGFVKVMKSF